MPTLAELKERKKFEAITQLAKSLRNLQVAQTKSRYPLELWVRVLVTCGYHDIHGVGEVIAIRMEHVTQMIRDGWVEVVCNNVGNNLPYDESDDEYSEVYI